MLRLLQNRIREAVLGDEFDPRVVEAIRKGGFLSGGAGGSSGIPADAAAKSAAGVLAEPERQL